MDYAALAKQYGGSSAAPAVDYAALAKQYGGSSAASSSPRTMGTSGDQIPGYGGAVPAAIPELTTGQKVYKTARPYVAPLLEGAGMVGGSLLGASAGTLAAPGVGTVAGGIGGAGLGYGLAKEGLELADVAMGMKPARQGDAQITEPLRNIAEGAAMEGGGRVAGQVLGKVIGSAADVISAGKQKAAGIARKALADDLPVVIAALKNASPNASVAEVTANIQNPTWQALIKDALEKDPQFVRKARLADDTTATNALANLTGGATATAVRGVNELAKSNLNAITSPMRETAIARANLGKNVATYETDAAQLSQQAADKVEDVRRLTRLGAQAETASATVPVRSSSGERIGLPLIPGRYTYPADLAKQAEIWSAQAADASLDLGQGARFAQGAADALRSVGVKPLEGNKLVQGIEAISNKPEFAGNDLLTGATKNVANDIAKWTSSGGIIDLVALEAIRKNSVNAAIATLRPGTDATSQRNLAAGVMSKIKPMIDDAIEGAGGAGWHDYLNMHAKGMQNIAAKKLTGEAAQLWKTDKDAFVRLVQNESPETVEKFMGSGNYDIAKNLSSDTMSILKNLADKRLTQLSVKEQVGEGGAALANLIKQQTPTLRIPQFLNFWATASNKAINELERHIGAKSMAKLTEAAKTPSGTIDLLQTLPATERSRILNLMSNPQQWKPGTAALATNALRPDQQNQNALVK